MRLLSELDTSLASAPADGGVLVAYSGGLDSTVLLDLARRWTARSGAQLAAVHVDHRLRPSSAADAAFCRRQAARWGVPIAVETLEVHRRGSVQENARLQRYAAIARAAARLDCKTVLTAHHADDALETALINLRRGTASGGLSSLLTRDATRERGPIPSWPDFELVRPLVEVPKSELRAYADRRGLAWRVDPTNRKRDYERNRLRMEVLPALTDDGRRLAPQLDTLKNLASEDDALQTLARAYLDEARLEPPDSETIALVAAPLAEAPAAVAAHALRRAVARLPVEASLQRSHLDEALACLEHGNNTRMSIPGARLTIERGLIFLEVSRGRGGRYLNERVAEPIELDVSSEEGSIPWFGTRMSWRRLAPGAEREQASACVARLALPSDSKGLIVRGPRPADRLDAVAMEGRKALGELLAEANVPRVMRWRWPCIATSAAAGEPLWVAGLRRAKELVREAPAVELQWHLEAPTTFAHLIAVRMK